MSSYKDIESDLYKIAQHFVTAIPNYMVPAGEPITYRGWRLVPWKHKVDIKENPQTARVNYEIFSPISPTKRAWGTSYEGLSHAKFMVDHRIKELESGEARSRSTPLEDETGPRTTDDFKNLYKKNSYGHGILYMLAKDGPTRTGAIETIFPIRGSSTLTYLRRNGLIVKNPPESNTAPWEITPLGRELLALRGDFDLAGLKAQKLYGREKKEQGRIEIMNQDLDRLPEDDSEADELDFND